jgi:hypothetical protein
MWNLFNQKRELKTEVLDKLRPGDLFGAAHQEGRQPEDLVRYLLLANVSVLTFFAVVLSRVDAGVHGHQEIYSAVWLTAMGLAIAVGAWVLFRLARAGEKKALSRNLGDVEADALPPEVKTVMKRAGIRKLLGFRVMIVSAISGCIAIYVGIKGIIFLL